MLAAGIEQESRAGFEHATELEPGEPLADFIAVAGCGVVRVEVVHIGRDRDSAVAEFGENFDGVFQPMMREPVRVVAEEHAANVSRSAD